MSSDDLSELGAAAPPINILEQQRQLRSQGPEKHYFSLSDRPNSPRKQTLRTGSESSLKPLPYDAEFDELEDAEVFISTNRNWQSRRQQVETAENTQILQPGVENIAVQQAQNAGAVVQPVQVVQPVNLLPADGVNNQNLPPVAVPVVNVQPPVAFQNIPNQQQNDQNVNNNDNLNQDQELEQSMAEDRTLLPPQFAGTPDEDAPEFLRRLKTYFEYKSIIETQDNHARLKLAKAMLVGAAQDWVEGLTDQQKSSFAELETAFKDHFVKPVVLRFRNACDIFGKRQGPDESVDQYATRIRTLAKRVDVDQRALLYAFVSGLNGRISSYVLGKNPENLGAAIDAARIAEMALAHEPPDVSSQLADLRKDIARLAHNYDTTTPAAIVNAAIQQPRVQRPIRQFNQQRQQRPFGQRFLGQQNYRMQGPRQPFGRGGYRQTWQPRPQYLPIAQGADAMPNMAPLCNKCGRKQHANINFCPAVTQSCLFCGRV